MAKRFKIKKIRKIKDKIIITSTLGTLIAMFIIIVPFLVSFTSFSAVH